MKTSKHDPAWAILGWMSMVLLLEALPAGQAGPVPEIPLIPGARPSPWSPLDLREIPGVGRLRSRRLSTEAQSSGLHLHADDLIPKLLSIPGVGPVTAASIGAWAAERMVQSQSVPSTPESTIEGGE